jgi:hypothetical protein
VQDDTEAIKIARSLLRRDSAFMDVRCALAAFLWAAGETSAAEGEWNRLQEAQGVFLEATGVLMLSMLPEVTIIL